MRCTYEKTIFENAENGYGVLVFSTQDPSVPQAARSRYGGDSLIRFTAVGYHIPATKAIDLELQGEWKPTKYGLQLEVEAYTEIIPQTRDGIIGYLSSGLIAGIGPKTAEAIVKKFGLQTLDILEQHPQRLLEVKGVTEKRLNKIITSYNQSRELRDILSFLSPFGITAKKAVKIYKAFGARSMDVLKKTPFELCTLSGFGFKTVDAIARKTACRPNDPMRILGALHYVMDEIRSAGHLYLYKDELRSQAYKLLNEGFPHEAVTPQAISAEMYVMAVSKILPAQSGNIYSPKSLLAEEYTAKKIAWLQQQPVKEAHIETELMNAQKGMGITLAPNQRKAVRTCFSHMLTLVTGGPGTGKTTILKAVLSVHRQLGGGHVLLMAPTGLAARRMAESTGYAGASTMHSAMGLVTEGEEPGEAEREPLHADLIIVDEFTMAWKRWSFWSWSS